ncbi:MAG: HNH endonuclease [Krumholzibacteria bacterium]|nr:HNH endonuclease [Candidatus Krumholzibacteria bacterium]
MARKPLGKAIRAQVLARDAYSCAMCGRRPPDVQLQVDHVVPVADGGTDIITNLAALCADCNRGKSSYHFGDYSSIRIVPPGLSAHFHYKSGVSERGDFTPTLQNHPDQAACSSPRMIRS